jgi:hypothetical protein
MGGEQWWLPDEGLDPVGDFFPEALVPGNHQYGIIAGDRSNDLAPPSLIQSFGHCACGSRCRFEYNEGSHAVHADQKCRKYLGQLRPNRTSVGMSVVRTPGGVSQLGESELPDIAGQRRLSHDEAIVGKSLPQVVLTFDPPFTHNPEDGRVTLGLHAEW